MQNRKLSKVKLQLTPEEQYCTLQNTLWYLVRDRIQRWMGHRSHSHDSKPWTELTVCKSVSLAFTGEIMETKKISQSHITGKWQNQELSEDLAEVRVTVIRLKANTVIYN